MSKFFKGSDFLNYNSNVIPGEKDSLDCIAEIANSKLMEVGIKTTYHDVDGAHEALIIKLNNSCKHPIDKIKEVRYYIKGGLIVGDLIGSVPLPGKKELIYATIYYECMCGTRVTPNKFEEV